MPSASCPPVAEVGTSDEVRDPERWLVALCWAVVVFALVQVLLLGFGRDQAGHALVGRGILDGQMPYRDVWDPAAPGIFLLHAAVQALLGESMSGLRLVEAAGLLGLVLCLRSVGAVALGSTTAGLVGGALAALLHAQLDQLHTGQPETFAGFFGVAALWVTLRPARRPLRQAALLGLLVGGVILFEPALGAVGLVFAAHLARRLHITRGPGAAVVPLVVLFSLALLPALSCLGWFAARGALGDLWWTLNEVATTRAEAAWAGRSAAELFYSASAEALVGLSSLVAAGSAAALLQRPHFMRERELLFLVFGAVSLQLARTALRGDFEPHHFGATLPLLALVAGLGWYKLWRRLLPSGPSGVLALTAFALVIGSMREPTREAAASFWQRSALRTGYLLRVGPASTREELERRLAGNDSTLAARHLASELRSRLSPTASLYVSGDEPLVYWLSSARPASRFVRQPPLPDVDPAGEELRQRRPTHLLLRPAEASELAWLEAEYERKTTLDDFVLYERRPAP